MKISWTHYAFSDRNKILDHIEAANPMAAILVDDRIKTAVNQLRTYPESGRPGRVQNTRELVVSQTSFIIAYTIAGDRIRILRILHGAQMWPPQLDQEQ